LAIQMLERLFVYGTLAPGRANDHVLRDVPGTWQEGTIRGHRRNEGWGARHGYPGVVVDAAGAPVNGYLFSSVALEAEWKRLDEFEGVQYERVKVDVHLAGGHVVTAYVYQLRQDS
jgi:gamma-glutamylcyclotransferase (GGCT)/AIG2-like uncharacterized protein YtfP